MFRKFIFGLLFSLISTNLFAVEIETYYGWLRPHVVDALWVEDLQEPGTLDVMEVMDINYSYTGDNEHFVAGHAHFFQTSLSSAWDWINTSCFINQGGIEYGAAIYPDCRTVSSYLPYYTSAEDKITYIKEFFKAESSGQYGGQVLLTVRQYIQPSGLPGYRKTIFKTDNLGKLAEFDNAGSGWIKPLYQGNFANLGTFTDANGRSYIWWLFLYPDLSQDDKDLSVESCVINATIYDEKICKETKFTIRGL